MSEPRVLELRIALSDATEKKIRSLAMLSPEAASQLEQQLTDHLQTEISEYFDRTVTEAILQHMGMIDGRNYGDLNDKPQIVEAPAPAAPSQPEHKLETLNATEIPAPRNEEPTGTDHGLSEDEDPQDNKSVEEQAEELTKKLAAGEEMDIPGIGPSQIRVPNAEEDAEAFLDASFGARQPPKRQPAPQQRQSGPVLREVDDGDGFDPRVKRAHISSYGGKDKPDTGQWYP